MFRSFAALLLLSTAAVAVDLRWSPLPALPDPHGFAGSFAGVNDGALIVAGGTNFPDAMPWDGGTKVWYDTVYELKKPDGPWQVVGKLPKPNGYGVSITTPDGLFIIGGGNADEHYRDVFRLTADAELPPLPKPCAFMAGCVLDDVFYIAGGIETPTATRAMNTFWAFDLKQQEAAWQELPPCPGKPRILACMAAADGAVHLFSGAALKAGADGKAEREWLQDAWRYRPGEGWQKLPDMPRVAVAAPNPAPVIDSKIFILGGDDGVHANFEPKTRHPGFPRSIMIFDTKSQTWSQSGEMPFSLVTANAVIWNERLVITGGEARPGVRSPAVWSAPLK